MINSVIFTIAFNIILVTNTQSLTDFKCLLIPPPHGSGVSGWCVEGVDGKGKCITLNPGGDAPRCTDDQPLQVQ